MSEEGRLFSQAINNDQLAESNIRGKNQFFTSCPCLLQFSLKKNPTIETEKKEKKGAIKRASLKIFCRYSTDLGLQG